MTTPAHKNQQPHLIAEVVKTLRRTPKTFESHGVHIHLAYVFQLLTVALWRISQVYVVGPACATQQDFLAVQAECTITLVRQVTLHLTDAEADVFCIRHLCIRLHKFHMQFTKFRLAQIMTPPKTRLIHANLLRQVKAQFLTDNKGDSTFEWMSVSHTTHNAAHRLI